MTHTKGPWVAADAEWIMSQRTGMGFRYFPVRGEGQTWDICNVFADEDDDEMQANVRLITNAPDMLEALCEVRDALAALDWEGDENWRHWDATKVDQLLASTRQAVNRTIKLTKEGRSDA